MSDVAADGDEKTSSSSTPDRLDLARRRRPPDPSLRCTDADPSDDTDAAVREPLLRLRSRGGAARAEYDDEVIVDAASSSATSSSPKPRVPSPSSFARLRARRRARRTSASSSAANAASSAAR